MNSTTSGNSTGLMPPTLTASELIRGVLLFSLMFLSLCANTATLISTYRRRHRQICVNLLVLHLCVADLVVTFFGLGGNAAWMLTVSWNGGNFLCKIFKYFEAVGLYSSAFIVTVISIDRCLAVIDPLALGAANRRTKLLIIAAWSLSALCSMPQLLVFSVVEGPFSVTFEQCVTFDNLDKKFERLYLSFIIITQYFAPLSIMVISYGLILQTVCRKLKEYAQNEQDATQGSERSSMCTATDTLCTVTANAHGVGVGVSVGVRPTGGVLCNSATCTSAMSTRTVTSSCHLRPQTGVVFRRARNKSMKIATAIVCTFVLCWTPYFVAYSYHAFSTPPDFSGNTAGDHSNNVSTTTTASIPTTTAHSPQSSAIVEPSTPIVTPTPTIFSDFGNWLTDNWYQVLEFFHRCCCLFNPLIYGALHCKVRWCVRSKRRAKKKEGEDGAEHCGLCLPLFKFKWSDGHAGHVLLGGRLTPASQRNDRPAAGVIGAQPTGCKCTVCLAWRSRGCKCQVRPDIALQRIDPAHVHAHALAHAHAHAHQKDDSSGRGRGCERLPTTTPNGDSQQTIKLSSVPMPVPLDCGRGPMETPGPVAPLLAIAELPSVHSPVTV